MGKKRWEYEDVKEYFEKYGYELLSEIYINNRTKLITKCPTGHIYEVTFRDFKDCGNRCVECYNEKRGNTLSFSYEDVKSEIEKHGYKLLSKEYYNSHKKLLLECDKGHQYEATFMKFKSGRRCPICSNRQKYDYEYVEQYIESFNYKLLSKKYINNKTKIEVMCPNGHIYKVRFSEFKNHERRCPHCQISKGERKIMTWLDLNNIEYVYNEEYFNDLFGNTSLLRPDFILPNYKIWIEYDGEFHYKDMYKDGTYEKTVLYDEIKNKYAKENGWRLIRIPYWEFENVERILEDKINN